MSRLHLLNVYATIWHIDFVEPMTKTVKKFEEPQCAERSVISLRLESVADSLH